MIEKANQFIVRISYEDFKDALLTWNKGIFNDRMKAQILSIQQDPQDTTKVKIVFTEEVL